MIEIKPMDEGYILIDCLHGGPVDSASRPKRVGKEWQDAPDLPPHPWSDETITEIAATYRRISEGWAGDPAREFMRGMIRRYESCALLAWEAANVVGFLRFYPLDIAHLVVRGGGERNHPIAAASKLFDPDPAALWVQCVMTCKPYETPELAKTAGARKGIGLKLVRALVGWARQHRWKRVVKAAHSDLDCFYGTCGGGGKAFWEKAGFHVVGTFRAEPWGGYWTDIIRRQREEKGMTEDEVWTWYRMAYEL
jgi:GNAT superfamily N-acetyltransferase